MSRLIPALLLALVPLSLASAQTPSASSPPPAAAAATPALPAPKVTKVLLPNGGRNHLGKPDNVLRNTSREPVRVVGVNLQHVDRAWLYATLGGNRPLEVASVDPAGTWVDLRLPEVTDAQRPYPPTNYWLALGTPTARFEVEQAIRLLGLRFSRIKPAGEAARYAHDDLGVVLEGLSFGEIAGARLRAADGTLTPGEIAARVEHQHEGGRMELRFPKVPPGEYVLVLTNAAGIILSDYVKLTAAADATAPAR
jgi:hypothetical protein